MAIEYKQAIDPTCEYHLGEGCYYHPLSDEFMNTPRYRQFKMLVDDHAIAQGFDPEETDLGIMVELWEEVQEYFDMELMSNPADPVECTACFDDGATQIRVHSLDDVSADKMLGKARSSSSRKGGMEQWR
jgi:hypothetical protein